MSPSRKRQAITHICKVFKFSQRRACRLLGQHRSSQRYIGLNTDKDKGLTDRILTLAELNSGYGYRKITHLLKQEGWYVNLKHVHRIWKLEGLQVKVKKKRFRPIGGSENACHKKKAECPNDVWTYDFVYDTTMDGATLKIMPILDEYTRECLSIIVERKINSQRVVQEMEKLFALYGLPNAVRSDNGGEYIAKSLLESMKMRGVKTLHIAPGSPWENGYSESFIGKLRQELLNVEIFGSLKEAQVLIEQHRKHYNEQRPHASLGYLTPSKYAAKHRNLMVLKD